MVSIDHFSGWPDAKFLDRPTTKKVIEFSKQYIAQYGVPQKIRTDPGTVFVSEAFVQFCKQFGIEHKTCPVRDHRGNGKIERLIRTINERLRTNKQIILTKVKSGLSEILYALRVSKKKDSRSPFEKHMGKEPNTVKSNLVGKFMDISERDPKLNFQPSDFQDETDSTILVRERSKGSKLESTFAKKTGTVVNETAHVVSILPEKSRTVKTFSKRECPFLRTSSLFLTSLVRRILHVLFRSHLCANASQKAKFKNMNKRRAILSESTSTSEGEEPVRKQKKKKKKKKKKKETARNPELAFDLENEQRPNISKYRLVLRNKRVSRLGQAATNKGQSQRQLNNHSPKSSKTPGMSRTLRKTQKPDTSPRKKALPNKTLWHRCDAIGERSEYRRGIRDNQTFKNN